MLHISATCENCIATNWVIMERQEALCRELRASGACLVLAGVAFGLPAGTTLTIPYREEAVTGVRGPGGELQERR